MFCLPSCSAPSLKEKSLVSEKFSFTVRGDPFGVRIMVVSESVGDSTLIYELHFAKFIVWPLVRS